MTGSIHCKFCGHSFEPDNSSGDRLARCPHCGRQQVDGDPATVTQRLRLIHNAPSLVGVKPCPKCKREIAANDNLCLHCGFNSITGQRMKAPRTASARRPGLVFLGVAVLAVGAVAAYRFLPEVELDSSLLDAPPPAESPTEVPAALAPAEPEKPEAEQPDFEARREKLAEAFRRKLDETSPLYRPNDPVELRLRSGRVMRGTLRKYAGAGTNRIAVVATDSGEEIVYVKLVDRDTRIRMDANYRENFIRHRLNIPPASPAVPATNHNARSGETR